MSNKMTDLNIMHLETNAEEGKECFFDAIAGHLTAELDDSFKAGMKERAGDIRSLVDTLRANVNNAKLTDADFRVIAGQIIESIYEDYL